MIDWKTQAPLENLKARAQLLSSLRDFFAERNVLEVETPLLASTTALDPHIQSMEVLSGINDSAGLSTSKYLQTSPEFAMKRLLGEGQGPIYQICKAFRSGESSKRHNPEFTLLEWYQPGYSMMELIDEVEQLVKPILSCDCIPRISYRDLFEQNLNIDPHNIPSDELVTLAEQRIELNSTDLDRTDYLQLLMTHVIEPAMEGNCFVYDFPTEQASLSTIEVDDVGQRVAKRFELYFGGIELANGYYELIDPLEQRQRFEADIQKRKDLNLPIYPVDERLIAAMEAGMPQSSGVALGVDRLLMLKLVADSIDEVLSFTTDKS